MGYARPVSHDTVGPGVQSLRAPVKRPSARKLAVAVGILHHGSDLTLASAQRLIHHFPRRQTTALSALLFEKPGGVLARFWLWRIWTMDRCKVRHCDQLMNR